MTTYNATATREGNWWVLDVDDVGVTQCARLTEAHAQIRGLIEAVEDRDVPEDTAITLTFAGPVDEALREARLAAEAAETLRDLAARKLRSIAAHLVSDEGLSKSEAAVVLDVSKQRMTQLLATRAEGAGIREVGDILFVCSEEGPTVHVTDLIHDPWKATVASTVKRAASHAYTESTT